jgi:hypothetical protein
MNLTKIFTRPAVLEAEKKNWRDQASVEMFLTSAIDNYAELLDIPCRDSFILDVAYQQIVRLQKCIEEFEAAARTAPPAER